MNSKQDYTWRVRMSTFIENVIGPIIINGDLKSAIDYIKNPERAYFEASDRSGLSMALAKGESSYQENPLKQIQNTLKRINYCKQRNIPFLTDDNGEFNWKLSVHKFEKGTYKSRAEFEKQLKDKLRLKDEIYPFGDFGKTKVEATLLERKLQPTIYFHEAPLYFHEAPHPHLYKKGECVKEAIIKNPKSYMELHKLMEEK